MNLWDLWGDHTFRTVTLGTMALGLGSGMIGSLAFLRRQSMLGDAVSHAALPGVVLAFVVFQSRDPWILLLGAALAGWVGATLIALITQKSRLDQDGGQALILSVFFGLGIMLLTWVQGMATASQAGLDRYLFGQAAALVSADLWVILAVESVAIVILLLLWKEWKLTSFDPVYAQSLGLPAGLLDLFATALTVLIIVVGLSVVGVVLMCALVVAPAAAARQWVRQMGPLVALAGLFGALSGFAGSLASTLWEDLPTGPAIVVVLSLVTALSLLFAPRRGLVLAWFRRKVRDGVFAQERLLRNLRALGARHGNVWVEHERTTLVTMDAGTPGAGRALDALRWRGLVTETRKGFYALTVAGVASTDKEDSHAP